MSSASFELMLDWAGDAVYETEVVIPKFFRKVNELDENKGFRDAFGMYYEEQASFQIQCMSEAVSYIPIEKWDAFLKCEGGWPKNNKTFENRSTMRKLTFKFLKENLGFGVEVVPSTDEDKKRFWVNAKIEEFIAEEMDAIDDRQLANELKPALREAFHKTAQHYIMKISYHAYNRGDHCRGC